MTTSPRARWLIGTALAASVLIALVVVVPPRLNLTLMGGRLVLSGGRLYECGRLGGSWPIDFADEVGLREGYTTRRLATVHESGLTFVTSEVVRLRDRRAVGMGVWIVGDGVRKNKVGPFNELARQLSSRPVPDVDRHRSAAAASRSCWNGGAG